MEELIKSKLKEIEEKENIKILHIKFDVKLACFFLYITHNKNEVWCMFHIYPPIAAPIF